MLIPAFLRQLNYEQIPILSTIEQASYITDDDSIKMIKPWANVRDILEYIACIEFSKAQLKSLPTGKELGSHHLTPARYDSASMVFFSQAALDNMAVWLNKTFSLGIKSGNNVSFYKREIKPKLEEKNQRFSDILQNHEDFIMRLNSYRMEWLHRVAGGALLTGDAPPSCPNSNLSIQVPIDPEIPKYSDNPKSYRRKIERTRQKNAGRWLMPVEEFAEHVSGTTTTIVIQLLEVAYHTYREETTQSPGPA